MRGKEGVGGGMNDMMGCKLYRDLGVARKVVGEWAGRGLWWIDLCD